MALDSASTASAPTTPACNLITHAARQSRKKPAPFSTQIPTFSSHVPPCFFKKPYRTHSSHCPAPDHCTCVSPQVAPECTYTPKRSPKELPRQISDQQRLRQHYRHGKRHEHAHGQHRIRARMQLYEAPCAAFYTLRIEIIYAQVQMVTAHIIMQKSRRRRYVSGILL